MGRDLEVAIIQPMTRTEAQAAVLQIKEKLVDAGQLLLDLYERQGYAALGYPTWRSCVLAEFSSLGSQAHVYRLLAASMTIKRLGLPEDTAESHVRPLVNLLDTDEQRLEAYEIAKSFSIGEAPTGKDYDRAGKVVYLRANFPRLAYRESVGDVTYQQAYEIAKLSERHEEMAPLLSECSDPELAGILAALPLDSDVMQEIIASGCVPTFDEPIPLGRATAATLKAWLDVSSAESRARYVEDNRALYDRLNSLHLELEKECRLVVSLLSLGKDTRLVRLLDELAEVRRLL